MKGLESHDVVVVLDVTGLGSRPLLDGELRAGDHVTVLADCASDSARSAALRAGQRGVVDEVDAEGDACVCFDDHATMQWVCRESAHRLSVEGRGGHIVFEKCTTPRMAEFLEAALGPPVRVNGADTGHTPAPGADSYEVFSWCDDPQCDEDETDAYRLLTPNVVFLGLPTQGGSASGCESSGDYNDEPVFIWRADIDAATRALIAMSRAFPAFLAQEPAAAAAGAVA